MLPVRILASIQPCSLQLRIKIENIFAALATRIRIVLYGSKAPFGLTRRELLQVFLGLEQPTATSRRPAATVLYRSSGIR